MGLTWTSALQDLAGLTVLQKAYTDLRPHEKAVLDGSATAPTTTPGGVAGQALVYVGQFAQWFAEATAAAADIPAAWEHVLSAEVAYRFSVAVRREDAKIHAEGLGRAWQAALDSYSNVALNVSATQDGTISLLVARLFIIRHLIRKRPRVYVPIALIDQAVRAAWEDMWYRAAWNFRVRNVIVTIPSGSGYTAPTFTLSDGSSLPTGEAFHSLVSPSLIYTATTSGSMATCEFADSVQMSAMLAGTTPAGRPSRFTFEIRNDGTRPWLFWPAPDQEYTARAQIAIAAPAFPTTATSTTEFAKLPAPFQTAFLELCLAHTMRRNSVPGWPEVWANAKDVLDGLLDHVQSRGLPESMGLTAVDVYQDGFGTARML